MKTYFTGSDPSPYKSDIPADAQEWVLQFDAEFERGRFNADPDKRLHRGCGTAPCNRPKCSKEHPDGECRHKGVCKGRCLQMAVQNAWESKRRGPRDWKAVSELCTHGEFQDVFDQLDSDRVDLMDVRETASTNHYEDTLIEAIDLRMGSEDGKNVVTMPTRTRLGRVSNF